MAFTLYAVLCIFLQLKMYNCFSFKFFALEDILTDECSKVIAALQHYSLVFTYDHNALQQEPNPGVKRQYVV